MTKSSTWKARLRANETLHRSGNCTPSFTAEHAENAEMTIDLNKTTETIIGAAIEVHRALGPGLPESTYEACLAYELVERGLKVERQKFLPVRYRDVSLDCGYRIDPLISTSYLVLQSACC